MSSDAELRRSLKALGYNPGPITPATRALYEKKLNRLRIDSRRSMGASSPGVLRSAAPARKSWSGPEKATPAWSQRQDHDEDEEEEEEEQDQEGPRTSTPPTRREWASTGHISRREWPPPDPPARRDWNVSAVPTRQEWTTSVAPTRQGRTVNPIRREWTIPANRTPPGATSARLSWLRGPDDPPTPWARTKAAWDSEGEEEEKAAPRASTPSWRPWGRVEPQPSPAPKRAGPTTRPRTLERFLSNLLAFASVALLAVFLGILCVKSTGTAPGEGPENKFGQMPMDCEGKTDPYCRMEQDKIVQKMLFELYNFLAKQAGNFECGNPEQLKSKCIPVEEARKFVANVSGHPPEKFDLALQHVMNSNRDLGIWLRGNDPFSDPVVALDKITCLESTRPKIWLTCRLGRALTTAVTNLILLFWVLTFLWGILALLKFRWRRMEEEEQAMYDMVKRITDFVRDHYKDYECAVETFAYVGVCHVRDTLIPHRERKKMLPVWDKAVDFLSANESRIRTESQCIAGEDMLVWRWTRAAKYTDS
ncbi:LEM domain-containing protein 2 [Ambystoma mexicanum]|uniref:LEM domain-containing protein 2 n=1 Tax=Ambystoma mexicanum TaxID=8296 RepID=UPI0037E778D6